MNIGIKICQTYDFIKYRFVNIDFFSERHTCMQGPLLSIYVLDVCLLYVIHI